MAPADDDSLDEDLRELARAPEVPLPPEVSPPTAASASTVPSPPPDMNGGPTDAQALPEIARDAYLVVGEHARGGIGRILRAFDRRLGRWVAIKELLDYDPATAARFVREAMVTARLQHPGIVPVHEAGRWPSGEPFYTMKLVEGRPLDELTRERRTLDERVALLPIIIGATEAVAYAHSLRVIHRDLKPANIIIGEFGEAVVIDWGLAKQLGEGGAPGSATQPADEPADMTRDGAVVGTPAFMAPEQAAGQAVDERADVYALGAVLYATLSGTRPYAGASASDVIGKVLAGPPEPVARRTPGVPVELAAIVDKAMAYDRAQRYPSARELAADLGRFQTGQLVAAHRYSRGERLRRWLRRNRVAVAIATVAALLLGASSAVSVARILRERAQAIAGRAEAEAARAREAALVDDLLVSSARGALQMDPTAAVAWLGRLRPASRGWPAARAIAVAAQLRGVAARVLTGHVGEVADIAFSPDGRHLASAGHDHTVRLWDLERGGVDVFRGPRNAVLHVAFSGDGRTLLAAGEDDTLTWWELATHNAHEVEAHRGGVAALARSPDGHTLATSGRDGVVRLWRLADGAPRPAWATRGKLTHLAFSPDGALLAGRDGDGVRLWRVADGAAWPLPSSRHAGDGGLAFSADGGRLAAGDADGVRIWTLADGRTTLLAEPAPVQLVAFAPDGRALASAASDGSVRRWDLERRQAIIESHAGDAARDLAFSADGAFLFATRGPMVRVFVLGLGEVRKLRGHALDVTRVALSPDGRLASASRDGTIRLWRIDRGMPTVTRVPLAPAQARAVALTPDGGGVAWLSSDGATVEAWRRGERRAHALVPRAAAEQLAWSPDGTALAAIGGARELTVWDVATGEPRALPGLPRARDAVWSADGAVFASVAGDRALRLWRHGVPLPALEAPGELVRVALSPEAQVAATVGPDGGLLWRLPAGPSRPLADAAAVEGLVFAPDGALVAGFAHRGREVTVWRVADGATVQRFEEDDAVVAVGFVEPQLLVVGTAGGAVHARDLAAGQGWELQGRGPALLALAASPAGVGVLGDDAIMRVWPPPPRSEPAAVRAFLQAATDATLDGGGHVASP